MEIEEYLSQLEINLLKTGNWQKIVLTRAWASTVTNKPGVYAIKENNRIIYVGESGNLRGRMTELLNSRQHIIRRTIGKKLFSEMEY